MNAFKITPIEMNVRDFVSYDGGESWVYVVGFDRQNKKVIIDAEHCGSLPQKFDINSNAFGNGWLRKDRFFLSGNESVAYKRTGVSFNNAS